MPVVISRYPPLQHPVIDTRTGLITTPWAHWLQGLVALTDAVRIGTRLEQPLATSVAVGTLYAVSDESLIERSNGTTWESFGAV
jgi:hypothetical protein